MTARSPERMSEAALSGQLAEPHRIKKYVRMFPAVPYELIPVEKSE
jgi:hypothetical protein